MTNALKEDNYEKAIELTPQLSDDYKQVVNTVREYKESRGE